LIESSLAEKGLPVIDVDKLELGSGDDGSLHVVGRGGDILELLEGEDLVWKRRDGEDKTG
jgi:hypothetical protein